MVMRVLLVEPKRTYDRCTTLNGYNQLNLGLLSIASNLESEGHKVDYFSIDRTKSPLRALERLLRKNYGFVGMGTNSATIFHQREISEFIKKRSPDSKIIFGGVYPWLYPKELLEDKSIDYVVRGFGELPVLKLIWGEPPHRIPGICYRSKRGIVINEPYIPKKEELSELKSIIDYSSYESLHTKAETFSGRRSLFTSFGCPFNCNFCTVPKLYKNKLLFRDIRLVIREIAELSKRAEEIFFVDPTINASKSHFMELFTSILEEQERGNIPKEMRFVIQARLDCFDGEMLELAKKLNIKALFGIESLSRRVRDLDLNKGGRLSKMSSREVICELDKIGKFVKPYLYFILATPKTTKKDLIDNLKYIRSLDEYAYEVDVGVLPFRGTAYYEMYKGTEYMVWRTVKFGSKEVRLPFLLRCKDPYVESCISKAFREAEKKYRKSGGGYFSGGEYFSKLFLEGLIKEAEI
jgi:radical SAM superfamily enzyme YgiQ (UPF0313 family)